jgi:hypothetical protein
MDSNLVRQNPAAVLSVLDGGEQEVDIGPDPAVEGISILAEMLCAWVTDHIFVGEPDSS